jgi:hypothetical protein
MRGLVIVGSKERESSFFEYHRPFSSVTLFLTATTFPNPLNLV